MSGSHYRRQTEKLASAGAYAGLLAGYQAQQKTIAAQAEEIRQQKDVNASLEARLARLEAALSQTKAAALQK